MTAAVLGRNGVLYSCVYMSVQLVFSGRTAKVVISREASYDWKKIVPEPPILFLFSSGFFFFFTGIRLALVNKYASISLSEAWVGPTNYDYFGYAFASVDFQQIFY